MTDIRALVAAYERHVTLPWGTSLAGPQRVWFAIYDPDDERKLRFQLENFRIATVSAGHRWKCVDLTHAFGEWMDRQDYRESYFEEPAFLANIVGEFSSDLARRVSEALEADDVDAGTVVAIVGTGALFGFGQLHVSALVERVAPAIRGRLLVFFPGDYSRNRYRLMGAGDGWNYLAVPITASEEMDLA